MSNLSAWQWVAIAWIELVVAYGDGEVLFVRELQYSWQNDNIDRLVVDINRTIGYVKQRISLRPDHAWVMGEHAHAVIDAFERDLDCPVSVDQTATGTDFWMAEVAGLPQRLDSNFIPRLARRAVSRKSLMRAAVLTGFSLFGAAAAMGAVVQWLVATKALDAETIRTDIVSLEQDILHMEEELRVFDLEQLRLNQLTADAFNLPALFLSHLGDMVPEGLVLVNASVVREDTYWSIELAGTTELPFDLAPTEFALLESRLSQPPWNAQITQSWQDAWMEQLKSGGAAADGAVGFRLTGRLR